MSATAGSTKKIGLWATTSLVVGNMIGAGIFLMPSSLAAYGGIGLVGWLLSSAGSIFMAIIFSKLSKLMPGVSGGPYTYTRAGFGDFMGFLIAWGYWISVWTANAAIVVSLVSALSTFFPILNSNPIVAISTGLGSIWILTWVNSKGIVASGNVQLITTILKVIPLLAVAIGGLFFIQANHFIPFNISGKSTVSAVSATAALTVYAFLGIECATIPAATVKDAEKTVPIATMLGTIFTTIIYILCTISVLGIIDAESLQHSVTPLADAADKIYGAHSSYWVSAGVAIAAFGALNGWILIQGQLPYAIAKDRLFPPIFGKENKKGVPVQGIIIGSVLVSLLMLMNYTKGLIEQFNFLILLSSLTCFVPYLFSMAAYVIITLKTQQKMDKKTAINFVIAALAFVFTFWIIAGIGQDIVYWGFLLLMAGIPVYTWVIRKQQPNK